MADARGRTTPAKPRGRKPAATGVASIDEILAVAENPDFRRVATCRILIRQDLAAEVEAIDAELRAAVEADSRAAKTESIEHGPTAPAVAKRREALQAELAEHMVQFRFVAVGRRGYRNLLRDNPPTDQQKATIKGVDHNPETFPVAVIAASWIDPQNPDWRFDPDVDDPEVERRREIFSRLEENLNDSQFGILWAHALDVNLGFEAPKGSVLAGLVLRQSSPSASTAAAEGSPDLSSLDGSSGQA